MLSQPAYAASPIARDISGKVIKDTQNSTLNLLRLQASDNDIGDSLSYIIVSLPIHGKLKEDTTDQEIITLPYNLSSNKLKYIPASGYLGADSFTYKANDGTADSNTATVSLNIVEWFAPIGIPEPEFGIKETYRMYDDPAKRNPALTYTQNAEGGYYTHYVDNTAAEATDTSNPYGTAERPRLTTPTSIPAGSIVELHGGPYTTTANYILWTINGNSSYPVFVRGVSQVNMPTVNMPLRVRGDYLIMENIDFDYGQLNLHGNYAQNFISIRHCEFQNGNRSAVIMGDTEDLKDIVVYDNHMHHRGSWQGPLENDYHGIELNGGRRIWVVDNHIHHNGGDGIQATYFGHSYNLYVGRNEMSHHFEQAIDIKAGTDVIVSENDFHDFYQSSAVRINDDRVLDNIWVIYNNIYNCRSGTDTWGVQAAHYPYIIGNKMHNFTKLNPSSSTGGIVGGSAGYVVNNVVVGADRGIAEDTATIENNIVVNSSEYHIYNDNTGSNLMRNNVFWQNGEPIIFRGTQGECINCIESDPMFVNPANSDFSLQSSSPAIESGIESEVYQRFYDLYGIDIRKDIEGTPRPQGPAWDIGAYEYVVPGGAVVYGDVSGDAEVSAYDAALTAQASVGLISLDAGQTQAADVSGDGEATAYDAALIAQKAVGLIDKFPVEG